MEYAKPAPSRSTLAESGCNEANAKVRLLDALLPVPHRYSNTRSGEVCVCVGEGGGARRGVLHNFFIHQAYDWVQCLYSVL